MNNYMQALTVLACALGSGVVVTASLELRALLVRKRAERKRREQLEAEELEAWLARVRGEIDST